MSITYLKVKIKSLAAEAAIIRREERGCYDKRPGTLWDGLNHHRRHDVRREARAALLAYGFLRGVAYSAIEGKSYAAMFNLPHPSTARVRDLVKKYGPPWAHERLDDWFAGKAEEVRRAA